MPRDAAIFGVKGEELPGAGGDDNFVIDRADIGNDLRPFGGRGLHRKLHDAAVDDRAANRHTAKALIDDLDILIGVAGYFVSRATRQNIHLRETLEREFPFLAAF